MGVAKMAAGFAVGYVLGTRSGRDTYERIVNTTRALVNQPAAQAVQATAHDAATTGAKRGAVNADGVTSAGAETVAGNAQLSRKGSNNQAATSVNTAIPTAAPVDPSILDDQPDVDRPKRSV